MVRRFRFKNLAYLIFAIVYYFTASITQVFAIPKFPTGRDAEFIENNILFYNPDGKKNSSCLSPDRGCQTSDGSDVSVVGDGFLGTDSFKNEFKSKFSKLETADTNFSTTSNLSFDDLISNLNTKTYQKNILISFGTENGQTLTKEQLDQIILAAGSSKTILLANNYSTTGNMTDTNKVIEDASKSYQNVKLIDIASKISSNTSLIENNQISQTGAKELVGIISSILNAGCSGSFTKYNFTDGQLRGISAMAIQENGLSPPVSVVTEASQMANLFESSVMNRYNQNANKEQGFIDMLLRSGWYHSVTVAKYSETANISQDVLDGVKSVLNNGKRTLPTGIGEHDDMNDVVSISNDGVVVDKNNRANYISKKTIIKNNNDSTYVFYRWADPSAPDNLKGDPFGYFQNKGIGEFEEEANLSVGGSSSAVSSSRTSSNTSVSSTGPATDPEVVVTSDFKNYAGDEILSQAERDKIAANRPVYEEAARENDMPWQILAVLHYREHSLNVSNPANGQGIYQLYSYTSGGTNSNAFKPAGPVTTEEFLRQTKIAAKLVKESYGRELTSNPDSRMVKKMFYRYNGEAYQQQALDMGFTPEQASIGEGSPYVMSRADVKRDSTKGGMSWYMYVGDHQSTTGHNERNFGAYVVYLALGGFTDNSGTSGCSSSNGQPGTGGYSGGGHQLISQTAVDLAWHRYDTETDSATRAYFSGDRKNPTPAYSEAQRKAGNVGDVTDCGRFVSVVLRSSGVDPNFPPVDTTGSMVPYLNRHPDLYDEIPNTGDTSVLQSGDILIVPGHIKLVVNINGHLQEVQASLHGHAPETSDRVKLTHSHGAYQIFRRKA